MLILKGFLIGIGKIIPGVSGSLLAISLGVYDKAINSLVNLSNNFKENIYFLGKLAIGVVIAIMFFSNVIAYLLNSHYLYTMSLFIGLILGTVPSIIKRIKFTIKNLKYLILSFLIIMLVNFFKFENSFNPDQSILNLIIVLILGMLDAFTTIIPGISGTATFIMLGVYDFILCLFSNPFSNLFFTICFGLGLILGIVIASILMNKLLRKYPSQMYQVILGFTGFAIVILFKDILSYLNCINFFISLFLIIIGFFLATFLDK